jgi:hypothetical protein
MSRLTDPNVRLVAVKSFNMYTTQNTLSRADEINRPHRNLRQLAPMLGRYDHVYSGRSSV